MCRIIAVANPKGGVKTTMSINLEVGLARIGRKGFWFNPEVFFLVLMPEIWYNENRIICGQGEQWN